MFPMLMLIQEEAAKHGEEAAKGGLLTPQGGLMIWTLIIFLILFFVLSKYAFKPITAAVEAREKALEEAIAGAKADRGARCIGPSKPRVASSGTGALAV